MERHRIRATILAMLIALTVGALVITEPPFTPPALAKGVARPKTEDDSSSEKKEERKKSENSKPQPGEESKPAPREEERQPSQSSDSAVTRREERRSDTQQEKPSYYQRREGTPDIRGQVQKREERRDPDYRFRKHYIDPFFHPYDHKLYSYYPYYDRGVVIIIDRDTWDSSRHRWRRSYEYTCPPPGSLEEALVDIEATWWEEDPEFLMWHIDHMGDVDVYQDGKYSHTLTPRQIYKLTVEALERTETTDFHFTSVHRHGFSARAKARHEYVGPDGRERTAYLTYYVEKVRNRWVIDRIDIREREYGSPRCFIATAAYGTPMEEEVLVLRQFRERYLLTNAPGRAFVAAYYKISPPIAGCIEKDELAKAVVRAMLHPVVQLCRLVVPTEAR